MDDEAHNVDALARKACADETGFGRRVQDKLRRYGRDLSAKFAGQVRFVYDAFRDPATPLAAKMIVAGALAYFILPTDALPDFLPAVGFTDDAAVMSLALKKLMVILNAHGKRMETRKHAAPSEFDALRLDLALARRDLARLEREAAKWRRVAKTSVVLVALLSVLYVWMLLSRS